MTAAVRDGAPRSGTGGARRVGMQKSMAALTALTVCVVSALAYAWRLVPNPDIAWLLVAAERVLAGAGYGSGVLEVNPPLIVWIYAVAVLFARLIPVEPHHALVLLTLLTLVASWLVARALLMRVTERWAVVLTVIFAFLVFAPGTDFSQREHFAAILTVPWAALAAARISGLQVPRHLVLGAAIPGATGFILKPYFLLAWLGMEAAVLLRTRRGRLVRLETLVAVGAGLAYIAATLTFARDYLPLVRRLQPLYGVYLQQRESHALLLGSWCLVLAAVGLRRRDIAPLTLVFGMGALGFVMAGAVQLKWFGYHFLPAVVFIAAAASTVLPPPVDRDGTLRSRLQVAQVAGLHVLTVLVLLLFAGRALSIAVHPLDRDNLAEPDMPALREFIEREAPGGTVLMLSTNIQSGFPTVPLSAARWGSRLPSLWPLFALYEDRFWTQIRFDFRAPPERTGLERWFTDTVYEDLVTFEPDILFVLKYDPGIWNSGGARRFDYLSYFGAEARYREVLSAFDQVPDIGRYTVLVRRRGEPR